MVIAKYNNILFVKCINKTSNKLFHYSFADNFFAQEKYFLPLVAKFEKILDLIAHKIKKKK